MGQSVLISGGGIVGSYLGLELASRRVPFKIVESHQPNLSKEIGIRTLTVNHSVAERLGELGVEIPNALIDRMNVHDGIGSGSISFHSDEADIGYLAKVMNFDELRNALIQKAGDVFIFNDSVESFVADDESITVTLSNGSTRTEALLVAAEGRNSKIAKQISNNGFTKNYHQVAHTFLVDIPDLDSNTAIQVFHEKEIFALMPCISDQASNCFSVVWSLPEDPNLPSHELAMTGLTKFENKLSCSITPVSEPLSFPLYAHHLDSYCERGVCIIADAAHSIHPLAGQGINLGFADAAILAEEIERAFHAGQNIGHLAFLKKYELRRKTLNSSMLRGVDTLFEIFQQDNPYFRVLRNTGLRLINRFSLLKKIFILHASGMKKI